MRMPRWPVPDPRDRSVFSGWQAPVRALSAGVLGAGGVLLLFGNSLREAFFVGLGWGAVFAIFSWMAGLKRWTWSKALFAFIGMVMARSLGVILAEPGFEAEAAIEGLASGVGGALVFVWLGWRVHQRPARTAPG